MTNNNALPLPAAVGTVKKLPWYKSIQYFMSDIAKGLFNGMIGNYLLYIYQPTESSGILALLPDNKLFGFITIMAILTGISKVVDAVTDPLVAHISDKCKSKYGRRMPFMRLAAIPYALCVWLVFLAPFSSGSVFNAVWVGFFLVAYYVFYTIFSIPQRALIPEIMPDPKKRIVYFSISTAFFMGSSAFMYMATLFVSWFKGAGLSPLASWRAVFTIFTAVGMVCLLLTAFAFREKDYVQNSHPPKESILRSFAVVMRNKNFVVFTLGDLFSYVAMAFFQTTMLYYITVLIRVPESQAFLVMLTAIATAICFFPLIVVICRKFNKKTPLLIASFLFAALFAAIYFGDSLAALLPGRELIIGIAMGLCVAYPFAAINIIPQSVLSDIIQEDCLRNGANREGFFSATKTFIEKIASAIAMIIVSSVLAIGAANGENVGILGVKLTGVFAAVFSLVSAVFFLFYRDKSVTHSIETLKADANANLSGQAKTIDNGDTLNAECSETTDAPQEPTSACASAATDTDVAATTDTTPIKPS